MLANNIIPVNELDVAPEDIRLFVKNLKEVDLKLKEARDALKKAVKEDDKLDQFDAQMKELREEKKEYLRNHGVLSALATEVEEAKTEKKNLIDDAKSDGIPNKEIDLAIKALKSDVDMVISTDIYKNIADLVD